MNLWEHTVKTIPQLATYAASSIIYNLYLHPLSRFPGPRLWQCSYIPRFKAAVCGELEASIKAFHEHYGAVVRYSPGELSFTTPAAWRDIYGFREHALVKDPSFYGLIHLSRDRSHSIFTADGEQHPRVRKALSYAFSERALRDQEPYVAKYVDLLILRLRELASPHPGSSGVVDLVEWYNFTTFDIIGELAIAQSFGCLRGSRYHEWVRGFWDVIKLGAFVRALAVSTYAAFPQLLRQLAPRSLKDARRRHLEYVGRSTERRLTEGELREKPDFISYVLKGGREEQQQQQQQQHKESGGGAAALAPGEVEANANFLLLAGTETTATALAGTTYYLLKNPAALRRATEEVRGAFPRGGGGGEGDGDAAITFATASADRLPYLQACLTEGLRIYPPGPIAAPRKTAPGKVTMIAGHAVPGGVTVGVHAWSASHSVENFHLASEFHPERWLGSSSSSSSEFAADRASAAQPFSYGPRNCLGKPFAYSEMRVILARMLWNFDMELAPESDGWEKQKVYTLWDKGPLMVKLSARDGR